MKEWGILLSLIADDGSGEGVNMAEFLKLKSGIEILNWKILEKYQ